jgi:hypothetical protein
MTLRRSADDLPVPLAVVDSSTASLPLLLGTGGSLPMLRGLGIRDWREV